MERGVRALLTLFSDFHLTDLLIRQELKARGIRTFSLGLLYFIDDARQITPTALATETGLPPTTIRRWLAELERRRHIERRPNRDDARSYAVALTPEGKRAKAAAAPAMRGAVRAIEKRLGWKLGEIEPQLGDVKRALQEALGFDDATGPDDDRRFWVDEPPPRKGPRD